MIELSDVTAAYGAQTVLEHCFLRVSPGEQIALMGPSGSGKTTLLKLIAGRTKPLAGTVRVTAGKIAYLFQEPRLLPWLTALENVNLVLSDSAETMDQAQYWLEAVGLSDAADKHPAALSGGMRQRVALARALAYGGDLYLLDEPMSALDEALAFRLLSLLHQYTQGKTVIFVTHSPEQAKRFSDKLYTLKNKRLELL